MKQLTFNSWLAGQKSRPEFAELAERWESRKGRLTRASVEKRAQTEYGFSPGVGQGAYDQFLTDTLPALVADDSALLALDPPL